MGVCPLVGDIVWWKLSTSCSLRGTVWRTGVHCEAQYGGLMLLLFTVMYCLRTDQGMALVLSPCAPWESKSLGEAAACVFVHLPVHIIYLYTFIYLFTCHYPLVHV